MAHLQGTIVVLISKYLSVEERQPFSTAAV